MEATRLRIEDINVDKKIFKLKGKGGKERYVIPLPDFWPPILDWMNSEDCPNRGRLIPSRHGDPMSKNALEYRFQRFSDALQKKNENAKRVRPHDLRRAFAIMWANLGIPLPTLQLILGHESIKTTMSYLPINIEHGLKWVSERFPEALEATELPKAPIVKISTASILTSLLNKKSS